MKIKYIIPLLLFGLGLPAPLMAADSIARWMGVSDGLLIGLMIGIIGLLLAIVKALSNSIESISKNGPLYSERKKNGELKTIALLLLMGGGLGSQAQEVLQTPKVPEFIMSNTVFWILLGLIIFLAVVIAILFRTLNTLIKWQRGEAFVEEAEKSTSDIFEDLKLVDRVPVEQEEKILLEHEYDGIRELDNNLPPWWKYMFYATIIFSFVYLIRYHLTGHGMLSIEEYQAEVEEAVATKAAFMAEAGEEISEENVLYLVDAPSIEKGAAIYTGNCATCHGQLGEGGAGPNLTDEYWLHGGNIKDVFKSIKYGIPAKGMIAWQSQFSPKQMQEVASYVLSLQGTTPPNAKAPQGDIHVEEIITEATDSTAADTVEVVVEIDR